MLHMKNDLAFLCLLLTFVSTHVVLACSWGQGARINANEQIARHYGEICLALIVVTFGIRLLRGNVLNPSAFLLFVTLGFFARYNSLWDYNWAVDCGDQAAGMAQFYAQVAGGLLAWQTALVMLQVWKRRIMT